MHQTILESGVFVFFFLQGDIEKGLEMKKLVLSGFLASEEIYINQLEALLLVIHTHTLQTASVNAFILKQHVCLQCVGAGPCGLSEHRLWLMAMWKAGPQFSSFLELA